MLNAGAARRTVTPPTWVPYLTSSGNGTCAPFEGVHDDLHARALVLDDGAQAVAVLAVDSIGYDNAILGPGRDFTRELRERVASATGLAEDALMLAATHAHSTPETIGLTPFRETPGVPEWVEAHLEDLAATVVAAWHNRTPVRAYAGKQQVQGVARYRRILLEGGSMSRRGALSPDARVAAPCETDEDLSTLYLETEAGHPYAVLLNYTAHAVIAMLLPPVSADYPGAAAACVEAALPGAVCLVTNGATGNVNTVHVTTCFEDVEAVGQALGQGALETIARLKQGEALRESGIQVCSEAVILDARACPPLAEVEEADASDRDLRVRRLARKLAESPIRAEVQLMGVGPVRWVGLPGEAFVETGLALKQAGASFVVGYANGWVGYLPIRRAYGEGGYEVGIGPWSRVAPGSAERLEAVGKGLLNRTGRACG